MPDYIKTFMCLQRSYIFNTLMGSIDLSDEDGYSVFKMDKEIASEIGAFACFIMEDIFTLRVHLKMLSEIMRGIKLESDIDAFLARILTLFCEYLEDVSDERKMEFIRRQPAYQMILDLNARI